MMAHPGRLLPLALLVGALAASQAVAETVNVYSAGSLRGLVTALSSRLASMGIEVQATFGGSGSLRERIEKGENPDLLLSADLASPEALAAMGRTKLPVVAFARNRLCLISRRSLKLTPANFTAKLLAQNVRIKTSQPTADPSGDYAMAMFDRIGQQMPGAAEKLRAKASKLWSVTPPNAPGEANPTAALFNAKLIDVAVTYCSASKAVTNASSALISTPVPDRYAPHPVYGLALLSENPAAARFALFLLSREGQSATAQAGLLPLLDDGNGSPVQRQ